MTRRPDRLRSIHRDRPRVRARGARPPRSRPRRGASVTAVACRKSWRSIPTAFGDPPAGAPRPGHRWLVEPGGDGGDRRRVPHHGGRRVRRVLLLHDVQAAAVRAARRVGVHERHVPGAGWARALRAPRASLRHRPRRVRRRGRVPRGVRPCAADAGELRLPRSRHARVGGDDRRRLQVGRARRSWGLGWKGRGSERRRRTHSAAAARRMEFKRETRIISRRVREFPDDSFTLDRAQADGAYETLARSAAARRCAVDPRRGEGIGIARPRRCELPHRGQVGVAAARCVAPLPRGQRRRGRAEHVQRSPAARRRPAHAGRGRVHRGLPDVGEQGVHLHPR